MKTSIQTMYAALLLAVSLTGADPLRADDWPQWLGPERDGVWREAGILKAFPPGGPEVRWRTKIGPGYSGPAVVGDRVLVMDRQRDTRAANPSDPFARGQIPGTERVLCLNEKDGSVRWVHEYASDYTVSYAAGPRATPTVVDGKVYTLGAEGHLFCLDLETGKVLWSHLLTEVYGIRTPTWGFAGSPLVHENLLICLVGGDGSTAVAFDKDTGKERWRALSSSEPGYCPPTLIRTAAGRALLIIWHADSANALDPASGEVLWTVPWKVNYGMTIATPRFNSGRLFMTAFYSGSLMLQLDEKGNLQDELWRSPKASEKDTKYLHAVMCTPVLGEDYLYGVCSYGQLRCLRVKDGERLWESLRATGGREERWANAFLIPHEDRYFVYNEQGDLIIARLTPSGYEELDRAHILDPNGIDLRQRDVVWSHPAFAHQSLFARNDTEIVSVSLKAKRP